MLLKEQHRGVTAAIAAEWKEKLRESPMDDFSYSVTSSTVQTVLKSVVDLQCGLCCFLATWDAKAKLSPFQRKMKLPCHSFDSLPGNKAAVGGARCTVVGRVFFFFPEYTKKGRGEVGQATPEICHLNCDWPGR